MTDTEIIAKIKGKWPSKDLGITNPALRRVFMKLETKDLVDGLSFLSQGLGFTHLSTITGLDRGDFFEVLYHLANPFAALTVRITAPRKDPRIPTITSVIPGAILYERELQDMFGLIVENIPDPRPLVLPDDWPAGQYPLRKDWKFERPPEKIPGGE